MLVPPYPSPGGDHARMPGRSRKPAKKKQEEGAGEKALRKVEKRTGAKESASA